MVNTKRLWLGLAILCGATSVGIASTAVGKAQCHARHGRVSPVVVGTLLVGSSYAVLVDWLLAGEEAGAGTTRTAIAIRAGWGLHLCAKCVEDTQCNRVEQSPYGNWVGGYALWPICDLYTWHHRPRLPGVNGCTWRHFYLGCQCR